jgi:uncharacterized protein
MTVLHELGRALWMAFVMLWGIFWGLNLGFIFSALIEELVSKDEMSRLLPDDGPRSISIATGLGAASSSCSYAAVAMARSMVRKGADFTAAMAFQFAATNLVLELSVLLIALLGWQFGAAELVGGPLMIVLLVAAFRLTLRPARKRAAVTQAERNVAGSMEGHAQMAMAARQGSWRERLAARESWVAVSHGFVMNWAMLWKDILVGVLVAGALSVWVPKEFWQGLFLTHHPAVVTAVWGAVIGPLIAAASFTCSVGNIPFASVLWSGGISFGGVIAFIFGDLIIPPILNIYRKYYTGRVAVYLAITFYVAMVLAALIIEGLSAALDLVPRGARSGFSEEMIGWNYTAVLNLIFALAAVVLGVVFVRTGGPAMMRHMSHTGHHAHGAHDPRGTHGTDDHR